MGEWKSACHRNPQPKQSESHTNNLGKFAQTNDPQPDLRLEFHWHFNSDAASRSLVRSAYLAAFAALGYSYILDERLEPVRNEITSTNSPTSSVFTIVDPQEKRTTRKILIVNEPDELASLVVRIGKQTVFLPPIEQRFRTLDQVKQAYEAIRSSGATRVKIIGKELTWPTEPVYDYDYDRLGRNEVPEWRRT
jgi:hypothetical protein